MNVLEKAEKALENLKHYETTAKKHELQAAAGTLGRCLGALGSRQNYTRHYANLLHTAIPTLLSLASYESAEIRLVGDEALNRIVVGGFAFHSHKTNIILQNQIDHTRNARWIRAALSRICIGENWLKPGVGKMRTQAQTLFPKLSQIVRQTNEIQLVVEALESNLLRILNALAEYTTDEEIAELLKALLNHVDTTEASVRRGVATCVAHLCTHRELLLNNVISKVYEKLWPLQMDNNVTVGWFSVIKAVFQINGIHKFAENDLFTFTDYLELYHLCLSYIQQSTVEHNIQNAVIEVLTVLLSQAKGAYKKVLLERHPKPVCLDERKIGHRRNISTASGIPLPSVFSLPSEASEPELSFGGALQLTTPSLSVDDLTLHTPETPTSDMDMQLTDTEQLSKHLTERLQEFEDDSINDATDQIDQPISEATKVNIGSQDDDDIPLKYCARLLTNKFLLTGFKGGVISDRSVRVSVKSSALCCLSELLRLYPQAMALYLDKDADSKSHNASGSSEVDTNQDNINEFILERNVCYQDSLTDSLSQELLQYSMDSQNIRSQLICKRDSKSLEKSMDSVEQKSSNKDVPSAILDCRNYAKSDLIASGISVDSTNAIMSISNVTTNSNVTSNDPMSTGYPMTSSADVLSSSVDLDMKFDHFGESINNSDNLDALKDLDMKELKKPLKRILVNTKDVTDGYAMECSKESVPEQHDSDKGLDYQHMSDIFVLFENHNDPQVRGLVRVCIGNYLSAALDLSHGDYYRWRIYNLLPKEMSENISTDKLVGIVLKGLSDYIHSTVNHTLSSLTTICKALSISLHWNLLPDILNGLIDVENNKYWLCRVNLCKLYERLPYERIFILFPDFYSRSKIIMDTLIRILGDQDQKVRNAAAHTIARIIPKIYPSKRMSSTQMVILLANEEIQSQLFDNKQLSLDIVRTMYFYKDIPEQFKSDVELKDTHGLSIIVTDLFHRLMSSNCKYFSQGLLEALSCITKQWLPWKHSDAYAKQGVLSYCLDSLDYCNGNVMSKAIMLDLCAAIYPVEIHKIMHNKTINRDIFERESNSARNRWQHLENERVANLSEKFLQVTLKMLNLLVHLIEEVNPNVHLNKSSIALPGSPVRKKTQEPSSRNNAETEEKLTLRKKPIPLNSLKANFTGHFYNEPFYMKLYENLRAIYSNHKINLDPKNSIFYDYLTTVLNCLAIQLELATEREFGQYTEEILYYLKIVMPFRADLTVNCVTQLLKCLFGTNMIAQYSDFMSIQDKKLGHENLNFFDSVMLVNSLKNLDNEESRRSSVSSNSSQKLSLDKKNPRIVDEKHMLIALENFWRNQMDRKWITNKKELERYIRLFEPVVIQSLKSYTMQNDIPLQSKVLSLLSQLLTLRVNYCMLDNDQIFIDFLMKQLDLVEQHEIPNCCELVNSILMFLVQLSSSKHNTKQIIEIPKLIQLCDGLMASGAHSECIAGLEPVAVKVFSNMGGVGVLGRTQQQEAQATREVLFYMLQKTMHEPKVLDLVSCVLSLSQEHPESYYRWSELATDTLLNLLSHRSIEIDSFQAISSLERLLDTIYKDVLLEQGRVEILLKILFKAPPDQANTPIKQKLRYLSIVMVLLRKVLILIPESEILLSINYLKSSFVSPQSIFFEVKPDIDPLNVQNINENCANLSPDVILVRFLFKTLTYAILEVDNCNDSLSINEDSNLESDKNENKLLFAVCVNIVVHVKHMLHLFNGCLFPLTAKTAHNLLHNEQSGLNTGLYSPQESIPMELLNLICVSNAHRNPMLAVHFHHLLIRLNFLSQKCGEKLLSFARNSPIAVENTDAKLTEVNVLQIGCFMAYCEYFVENGISDAVHLTWLIVNRVHVLVSHYSCGIVRDLVNILQKSASASGLLLQAIAARCQAKLKDEFALNTYRILSLSHESQSGPLIFLICRIIGKLEPALAAKFARLAIEKCELLKELPVEKINVQLTKEDVQVALELLQRDKVHVRFALLVKALNGLASSAFDLSPLDLSQERTINPQYIISTSTDGTWLLNHIKNRCCQKENIMPKILKNQDLALVLSKLSKEDLATVMTCPEFNRNILSSCFKVACDNFTRQFLNVVSVYETKETEKDFARKQKELAKKEEILNSIDNKLNVVNSLHVFKRNDSIESKSRFFIPISKDIEEKFGNLEISQEEFELTVPDLPDLYQESCITLDRSLLEIIRLFPKQNRPISKSENFDLNSELTIDRYTRRCHQVFQDKLFHQEFITIHTVLTGLLDNLRRIVSIIDETDCDLMKQCRESILPSSLTKNLAVFSVISLQYLSFLIKNKKLVESPVHVDVSFRVSATATDNLVVDNVILVTVENISKALSFREIWTEFNIDSNVNRTQSALSCLYAIVKYLVKDTKPLILKNHIRLIDDGPKSDWIITGDKLVTLLDYWELNFYIDKRPNILGTYYKDPIEKLIIALSRLHIVSNVALIPPLAWPSVDVPSKADGQQKIDLPLQALQDTDVLEAFLFRVNLIGWSSKKQFEEIWMVLLSALQGNGTHWAVRGITQLLIAQQPTAGQWIAHIPRRQVLFSSAMQRLRNILVGTKAYNVFDNINLERIPLINDKFDGYHIAQYNTDYLKMASELIDEAPYKVRQEVKRARKQKEIDINSCLQLLMDVTSQMLEPKAPTGLAARLSLLNCIITITDCFKETGQWCWGANQLISMTGASHALLTQYSTANRALLSGLASCLSILDGIEGLQELSSVHQKLVKSLSSSYSPLRQAALHGCLQQLSAKPYSLHQYYNQNNQNPYLELVTQLKNAVKLYLAPNSRISLYEQSLYWTILFTLVEQGHSDIMNIAIDFLLTNPRHYCTDLVVRGITIVIRQQVLPKDLKKNIIEKLLEKMSDYSEDHAIQILMVHLFSADNKLLSPKLTSDVSNMDPDVLMNSMERITLLYKVLRQTKNKQNKEIIASTLKYFLRETLPPAATLSRVVIEFLECCKETEKKSLGLLNDREGWIVSSVLNAEVVFEVFETAVSQDQLPVLSGWIFEALSHLLNGKTSSNLLPYCVLTLLVSASSNNRIRNIAPLCYNILKSGFEKNATRDNSMGALGSFIGNHSNRMSFSDRRLLCLVACQSGFSQSQLDKLKELCESNDCMNELLQCLAV